jgi:hypothetical protein
MLFYWQSEDAIGELFRTMYANGVRSVQVEWDTYQAIKLYLSRQGMMAVIMPRRILFGVRFNLSQELPEHTSSCGYRQWQSGDWQGDVHDWQADSRLGGTVHEGAK